MRNPFIPLAAVALAVASPTHAADRPNILLILADDVGSDAIGCYGGRSYPTRHIDRLAAEGLLFEHAYAMPVCHPSRICLLTGRYPFRFGNAGSRWGDFPAEAESITLARRLKQADYASAVAGKWQLCFMRDDRDHPGRLGFDEWCLFGWHEGGRYHDPLIYENGELRKDTAGEFGPELYVDFLIDFMERRHAAGQPFFAFYPMALCHDVTDDLKDRHVAFYRDQRWMTYAEMMAVMDDMVGRLVAALDRLGIREDTIILFTTDNGTAGASYLTVDADGRMVRSPVVSVRNDRIVPGGKGRTDDSGTRVPLIVNWPGRIAPGQRTDRMVDLTDFLPTLADVAALPAESIPRDGVSFADELTGERTAAGTATAPGSPSLARDWIYIEHRGRRCVRARNWKLYGDGPFFAVDRDPREQQPLAEGDLSPQARRQRERLESVLSGLTGPLN